jgi:type IV pilus assembly protein PilA
MFCSRCGAGNPDTAAFCVSCGTQLQNQAGIPAPGSAVSGPPHGNAGPPETSGKAIASLICGLFFFIFPSAVAAIILGHLSLSDINKSAGRLAGRGMAITGLVFGYGGILFIPFLLIVAAIAIPNLLRAKMAANEASATASLRAINTATGVYASEYKNGFPPSLPSMDEAETGTPSCEHAHLIDRALATGQKDGYIFDYVPTGVQIAWDDAKSGGCAIAGTQTYDVQAYPLKRGTTGLRSYYTDQTGVIRVEQNGFATADSPPLGSE